MHLAALVHINGQLVLVGAIPPQQVPSYLPAAEVLRDLDDHIALGFDVFAAGALPSRFVALAAAFAVAFDDFLGGLHHCGSLRRDEVLEHELKLGMFRSDCRHKDAHKIGRNYPQGSP